MIPLLCELLKPLSDFVPTQVENRSVRKWEQIHLGAQRGSTLPNISGPWFPHLESEGDWTRLATLSSLWSLQVWRFSGGFQSYVLFGGFCCYLFCFKRRKNCFSSRCDWELLGVSPVQGPVARGGHTEMRMTVLVGEDAFTGAYNAE